jgi:hypothetical protein
VSEVILKVMRDDLGDDDGRDCRGSVGGIDPFVRGIIM